MDFNDNHPELRGGEVWLTNSEENDYHEIGWKTKRLGDKAYDTEGKRLSGLWPVFVQASELEKSK